MFDIAFDGKLKDVKFQPSRIGSQLKGAGVLANTKPINTDLLSFAAHHGLTREELTAAILNRPLKAEKDDFITYFPDVENKDYSLAPSAYTLNEAHKENKAIAGLKTVQRYKISFVPK